jgi:hypothetical protein
MGTLTYNPYWPATPGSTIHEADVVPFGFAVMLVTADAWSSPSIAVGTANGCVKNPVLA